MEHERRIFEALEKRIRESGTGLRLLHMVTGAGCYPPDEEIMQLICDCRDLGIEVLSAETDGRKMLVAGEAYDDVYAVSLLPEGMHEIAAARYLQRQLAADGFLRSDERLLPASDASLVLKRWEWQVSVIFGSRFAARLMEKACAGQGAGRLTSEGLERVRRHLIRATCGCVDFTEST